MLAKEFTILTSFHSLKAGFVRKCRLSLSLAMFERLLDPDGPLSGGLHLGRPFCFDRPDCGGARPQPQNMALGWMPGRGLRVIAALALENINTRGRMVPAAQKA